MNLVVMGLLIYGANGYTGELIARRAAAQGVEVTLASRDREPVAALARELRLPHRVFALDNPQELDAGLQGMKAVIHCAGPFVRTATPMVDACLRNRVHYLDITGEISVLEGLASRHAEALAAGVILMPGAGFDVVASDCLAAHVARRLPSATHLALALAPQTSPSRGSTLTLLEIAESGALVRSEGKLIRLPMGLRTWSRSRRVDFGDGPRKAITISLGDVASAYHTTGIGNIDVYVALPAAKRWGMVLSRALVPLLTSFRITKRWLQSRIRKLPLGPTAEERARCVTLLWAEARDRNGGVVRTRLRTPEAYEFTAWTALDLGVRAIRGELPPGFQTPGRACGPDYVLQFAGVTREDAD